MSFLNNLVSEFTHHGHSSQQQSSYSQPQPVQNGPPPVYPPWRCVWDAQDNRWLYINDQTGQRTFEHPHPNYNGPPGYAPAPGYQMGAPAPAPAPAPKKNHNLMYAAGGLAAGALLMHEGEKVEEHWKRDEHIAEDHLRRDEFRAEDRMDRWGDDVRFAPDAGAAWAGREVVEVEDFPDRLAGRIGEDVGDVERFDDGIVGAFDAGRDEQRFDDQQFADQQFADQHFDNSIQDAYDAGRDQQRFDDGW